jgi:hypothetical protein
VQRQQRRHADGSEPRCPSRKGFRALAPLAGSDASREDGARGYNRAARVALAACLTVTVLAATPIFETPRARRRGRRVPRGAAQGRLVLDTDALVDLACSFTVVGRDGRIAGSFAYLKPLRRARRAGWSGLRFELAVVHVYGASAVASCELHKSWVDQGVVTARTAGRRRLRAPRRRRLARPPPPPRKLTVDG